MRSSWFSASFPRLVDRHDLDSAAIREIVAELMNGSADHLEAACWLTALRMKGESAAELAAAALVLRSHMIRLDTRGEAVLDTCGTGGDHSGSFNISTAAAFVVAGAGVKVVKHGNRAVSSKSGSADVLSHLGVPIDAGTEWSQRCLDNVGFAFCFAPHFHPAMANVAPIRKKLGVRTLFNLIGPLANPAMAAYQLMGVGQNELVEPLAGALAELGSRQAILVNGHDGLDEVTLAAPTRVRRVREGRIEHLEWTPSDFELDPVPLSELLAENAASSAAMIQDILGGTRGGPRRVVLANAAAALYAAERVQSLPEGVAVAERSLDSGAAARVLSSLVA